MPSLAASPCEAIDYCSNSKVCSYNGTCTSMSTEATCDCYPGFTGSRCQHNVDDCAATPGACLNGATCRDKYGTYACDCAPGYTGRYSRVSVTAHPYTGIYIYRYIQVYTGIYTQDSRWRVTECDTQPVTILSHVVNTVLLCQTP